MKQSVVQPNANESVCTGNSNTLPSLYVFNAAALSKPHALEQLNCDLISNNIDVAIITETHLRSKHVDNVISLAGYSLFRRDREGRRGGGVAMYIKPQLQPALWLFSADEKRFEILWVRLGNGLFIAAVYNPPKPIYTPDQFLDYLDNCFNEINDRFALPYIVLAGDLNSMPDQAVEERTGLIQIVHQPTRGARILDRIFVTDMQYVTVRVVASTVYSDHRAIVAYAQQRSHCSSKVAVRHTFRRKSPTQNAHFLRLMKDVEFNCFAAELNIQEAFDNFYDVALHMLNTCYPIRTVTITSRDPSYITPDLKQKLRRKNRLMRSGRVEEAGHLAIQIRKQIERQNKISLVRINGRTNPKELWKAVQQVTGQRPAVHEVPGVTADSLNLHYAATSTDKVYQPPHHKQSVKPSGASLQYITEWEVFRILDRLHPTATGLDQLPAWYLRLGAAAFSAPITLLINRSLAESTVPKQWKAAWIQPVPKVPSPIECSDYRPISITPVLTRVMEKMVVKHFLYPALLTPPANLSFADQFAFRPTGSTTATIITLLDRVTHLLVNEPYVVVMALDFSKAFDRVRHSTLLEKLAQLDIPDHVYNWIADFFHGHSHCVKYEGIISAMKQITASIIQGSALGPASYVVNAADLQPVTPGNETVKYADDTYVIIPAANVDSRTQELENVEKWANANNLLLNRAKTVEIVFVDSRRSRLFSEPSLIEGIKRVTEINLLGVTIGMHNMTVSKHITNVLQSCTRSLYALRVLRAHGLQDADLQTVFRAVVTSKLVYASSAWIGFANAADLQRVETFFSRCMRAGYRSKSDCGFKELCETADKRLFFKILNNECHVLYKLLPPKSTAYQNYELRPRIHYCELPDKLTKLTECNFIRRQLYFYAF